MASMQVASDTKDKAAVAMAPNSDAHNILETGVENDAQTVSWWKRGYDSEDKKLLLKLDFFILSRACFGYFLRLLDTTNMTNAYVSGMKEASSHSNDFCLLSMLILIEISQDLNLYSDEYNLFSTFWTIGYTIGMIPSQVITSYVRPSVWIPFCEVIWAVLTFCFASVQNAKTIYAMRFLIGLAEAPFYIGVMTLLGNWYTPKELATRAGIFYSASFAATMFSGYLQAGVYTGLNGRYGLAGWRWLFIMCGVINVPGALWGFVAVPDSPYNTRVFYLSKKEIEIAKARMDRLERKPFNGITIQTFRTTLRRPFVWVFILNYIFFCLDTYSLLFFAIYLKSLGTYTVQQINLIPTGASAVGLVGTIIWGVLSDRLNTRIWIALVITAVNVVSNALLAAAASKATIFFGYMINAATYAYGPVIISYMNEVLSSSADERALILGIAQAVGAAFSAWVPLFIFNTGTQAPLFNVGFATVSAFAAAQGVGVLLLGKLGKEMEKQHQETDIAR